MQVRGASNHQEKELLQFLWISRYKDEYREETWTPRFTSRHWRVATVSGNSTPRAFPTV